MITSIISVIIAPFFPAILLVLAKLEFFICHFTLVNDGLVMESQTKD